MNHDFHHNAPNYDSRQIWVDGCAECESLGANVPYSIGELSDQGLRLALERAIQFNDGNTKRLGPVSSAEMRLLIHLEATVQVIRRLRFMGYDLGKLQ